ncbi:MAG TPA: tripartite tricarboxylate transporter substrate binding protein [Xanthobacteraceae bacterium]|jgi:tripartite-type tricarboxylate transporter receptor subunit TctC|nr:tripartite tricarboxylate transporter substrate binding protein [Xanthobacteraceae bacterium]
MRAANPWYFVRLFALLIAVAAAYFGGDAAAADDYPVRPILLIVPYPAGGGNDVLARLVAAKMSATLGQPIVIENRGGAGSTIGTRDVARSAPDGYTILIATSSLAINPQLYPDTAYDPVKDFAPIGLIAKSPNLVLVNPSLPAHNIAELIALAKKEPGRVDFASTGIGTSTHLAAMLFATMAGVTINPVPYKGVAPALTDLIGGQVPLMFCPITSAVGFVKAGNLRALALTGTTRSPSFPDLPTVAEDGLPGYAAELHYGLLAPGGTPPAIVAKLNAALNAALAEDDIKSRLSVDGAEPLPSTPEAYAADIASEEAKYSAIVKMSGRKPE